MGLLDRLAGNTGTTPYVEFTVSQYLGRQGTRVDWRTYRLSPLARQLAPSFFNEDRHDMFDRQYVAVAFYGSALHRLPANSDVQSALFQRASQIAEALTQSGPDADAIERVRAGIAETAQTHLVHRIQSSLRLDREGRLVNHDTFLRNGRGWWVAPIGVLGSLVLQCDDRERTFLGDWLLGMQEFYQRRGAPAAPRSAVLATEYGLARTVDEALARIRAGALGAA